LPKQYKYPLVESMRNVNMITDSINHQLTLCNCSQRPPQTSSNSDP